jgi:eukaryotic translation initiation factor 2C
VSKADWNLRDFLFPPLRPDKVMKHLIILNISQKLQKQDDRGREVHGLESNKFNRFAQELARQLVRQGIIQNKHVISPEGYHDLVKSGHKELQPGEGIVPFVTQFLADLNRNLDVDETPVIMMILPEKDDKVYAELKRVADCHFGFQTVFAVSENIQKTKDMDRFVGNITLKFQYKLSGDTHRIDPPEDIKNDITVIFGADVGHPPPGAVVGCPSVAAVVCSRDDKYINYLGSVRLQRSRQEFIANLGEMVKERLVAWIQHNNRIPKSILFYRDGVSESQYAMVQDKEIPQIDKAWNEVCEVFDGQHINGERLDPATPPKLTFIVVGKRHNTRFYPMRENDTYFARPGERRCVGAVQREKSDRGNRGGNRGGHRGGDRAGRGGGRGRGGGQGGSRGGTSYHGNVHADNAGTIEPQEPTYPEQEWSRCLNGNLWPGFYVEDGVTHPDEGKDFFLQSHQAIQGTARSAHYYILKDDMNLGEKGSLRQIVSRGLHLFHTRSCLIGLNNTLIQTHTLCYAYAKATKGISYCAPAYCADKLCDRGRAYLVKFYKKINDGLTRLQHADPPETYGQFCDRMVRWIASKPKWDPDPPKGEDDGKWGLVKEDRIVNGTKTTVWRVKTEEELENEGPVVQMNPWHPKYMADVMFYL